MTAFRLLFCFLESLTFYRQSHFRHVALSDSEGSLEQRERFSLALRAAQVSLRSE